MTAISDVDHAEYKYTVDLLIKHISDLKATNSIVGFESLCLDNVILRAENMGDGAFVFCLSREDNQLSQWRGYAGGGGVASGFK